MNDKKDLIEEVYRMMDQKSIRYAKFDEYTVVPCTAIALDIDDERQNALFVFCFGDCGERIEYVVFGGYDFPEDADEWKTICGDGEVWDSDCETINTVEFL